MSQKMLIDASQPEETRVALIDGNRLEEFDFELADRKQIRGNIYLAKVIRVEASLQAAFLEYGGGRHGFLPFSEIHPDYYNIPVSDRAELEAMLADIEPSQDQDEDDENEAEAYDESYEGDSDELSDTAEQNLERAAQNASESAETILEEETPNHESSMPLETRAAARMSEATLPFDEGEAESAPLQNSEEQETIEEGTESNVPEGSINSQADNLADDESDDGDDDEAAAAEEYDGNIDDRRAAKGVDEIGGEEFDQRRRQQILWRFMRAKNYRIQEVIKARQILLVQVGKEERGNKGAALTTNISLPGRYCVLMPNTARGGGVSRKITNMKDRKRLKSVMDELTVPDGMSLILRTAGIERSKAEIKRDFSYLMKLWDDIRERTLNSIAPTLVHEESNLIKRSIRDLYRGDASEIFVAGEDAHKTAKSFMKALVPSHIRRVKLWENGGDLFRSFNVEKQIDAINNREVKLKSGGYLVIDQTEAMIAIDVNSGRATRQRNIEDTALRANLEAAEEVARQMRLRDLAGLIVIDFIDMDIHANDIAVEKRLKEALRNDRARIQVGRIGPFGLLELSRQRMRPNLIESKYVSCSACNGRGLILNFGAATLLVMRALQAEIERQSQSGSRGRAPAGGTLLVKTTSDLALHILNAKREAIGELEAMSGFTIRFEVEPSLTSSSFEISFEAMGREGRGSKPPKQRPQSEKVGDSGQDEQPSRSRGRKSRQEVDEPTSEQAEAGDEPRGRRRRRKRKSETASETPSDMDRNNAQDSSTELTDDAAALESDSADKGPQSPEASEASSEPSAPKPRSRRRPASRNSRTRKQEDVQDSSATSDEQTAETVHDDSDSPKAAPAKPRRTRAKPKPVKATEASEASESSQSLEQNVAPEIKPEIKPEVKPEVAPSAPSSEEGPSASVELNVIEVGSQGQEQKSKGGWWKRFSSN